MKLLQGWFSWIFEEVLDSFFWTNFKFKAKNKRLKIFLKLKNLGNNTLKSNTETHKPFLLKSVKDSLYQCVDMHAEKGKAKGTVTCLSKQIII